MANLHNIGHIPAAERIVKYCFAVGGPVTTAQVAVALDLNRGTVTNAMVLLAERKQIYRCTWGKATRGVTYSAFASDVEPCPHEKATPEPQNVAAPRCHNIFGTAYTPPMSNVASARPGCVDFLAVPSRVGEQRTQYRPPRLLCD